MSPSATVRYQARQALKGNYAAATAAFMLLLLEIFFITAIIDLFDSFIVSISDDPVLIGVLEILILTPIGIIASVLLSPLYNGFVRLFYLSGLTGEFSFSSMFYYFEKGRYHRTLMLNLSLIVRLMIPTVFIYHIVCVGFFADFVGTVPYRDLEFILSVMSTILLILYSLKYFIVLTIYCIDEQSEPRDLIRISKEVMANQKGDAAQLFFSFTPWMLLCLLIIPSLYVVPYMTQSLCIGAKWMTLKGK